MNTPPSRTLTPFFDWATIAQQSESFTVELIDARGDAQYNRTLMPEV